MKNFNRPTALAVSAIALLVGSVGPWVTLLGIASAGPTNSLEVALVVFGGIGLVILSALTSRYMRTVSIVVALIILAEAINSLTKIYSVDADVRDWVAPGWGLYLTILTCVFLAASTWIARKPVVSDVDEDIVSYYGRCDTCGSPCDEKGCAADRSHVAAIDPTAVPA